MSSHVFSWKDEEKVRSNENKWNWKYLLKLKARILDFYPSPLSTLRLHVCCDGSLLPDFHQINQFHHVPKFLCWISFESHSIFLLKNQIKFRSNTFFFAVTSSTRVALWNVWNVHSRILVTHLYTHFFILSIQQREREVGEGANSTQKEFLFIK